MKCPFDQLLYWETSLPIPQGENKTNHFHEEEKNEQIYFMTSYLCQGRCEIRFSCLSYVVYFDQLSGACSTWKLVEILFFRHFQPFLNICVIPNQYQFAIQIKYIKFSNLFVYNFFVNKLKIFSLNRTLANMQKLVKSLKKFWNVQKRLKTAEKKCFNQNTQNTQHYEIQGTWVLGLKCTQGLNARQSNEHYSWHFFVHKWILAMVLS